MLVEGKRLGDAVLAHEGEADPIDEGHRERTTAGVSTNVASVGLGTRLLRSAASRYRYGMALHYGHYGERDRDHSSHA